jgi:hypothetical protein
MKKKGKMESVDDFILNNVTNPEILCRFKKKNIINTLQKRMNYLGEKGFPLDGTFEWNLEIESSSPTRFVDKINIFTTVHQDTSEYELHGIHSETYRYIKYIPGTNDKKWLEFVNSDNNKNMEWTL